MERKKTALSRFFDVIDGVENVVLAIMVVGMIFTILVQIIGRVIGHPFPWTEETSRYLFLWMMFVALAAGFNQAESSRVTLFVAKAPKWLRKFSEILYAALMIPMYIIGICQPVAGVLGIIGVLQSFMEYHGNVEIAGKSKENKETKEKER